MTNEKLVKEKLKNDQSEADKGVTDRHLENCVRQSVTTEYIESKPRSQVAARTWLKNPEWLWVQLLKFDWLYNNTFIFQLKEVDTAKDRGEDIDDKEDATKWFDIDRD